MAKKSNPEKELKLDENVKVEIIENSIEATGLDEKDIQINSLIEENKELKETVDVLNNQSTPYKLLDKALDYIHHPD